MRFSKSKFAETIAVLAVAAIILASFTSARADHGRGGTTAVASDQGGSNNGGNSGGRGGNSGGNTGTIVNTPGTANTGAVSNTSGGGNSGRGGNGGGGNGGGNSLASLKTLPIPATDFSAYINPGSSARNAAIALGKALFWDTQSGGDGQQACASCHFNAGADSRTKGQINPGAAGAWQVLAGGAAANYIPAAADYPLHMVANLSSRSQVIYDSANITGSQGLHHTKFVDVFPGSPVDVGAVVTQAAAPDPYGVPDANDPSVKVNTRRTTGKNAPTVVNAVYNFRNFWDGRAQNVFNGANPSGANDPAAFVLAADSNSGQLLVSGGQPAHQLVRIANAALASQSVGPPNNPVEMSYDGRDFKKLGKKMLSLTPLAGQLVATNDSVLGAFSNQSLAAGIPGISASYIGLIQEAFQSQWWNSNQLVDAKGNFVRDAQGNILSGPPNSTDQFTLAEFNFSLFWGIAIQMYESTLVANDSRFDRYMDGDRTALSALEQKGLDIFQGKGHCADCHMGATLSDAAVATQASARSGGAGNPFPGFHMIGVRPAEEDKIIAGGAAKTPGLRNVELTPPYMHNGGELTLEQVVLFYARGGDFGTRGVDQDSEIEPRSFNGDDIQALVAFLKSLTDPRVANQSAPFDHPSIDIPNGALGNNVAVTQDGTGNAVDDPDMMLHVAAAGANGANSLPTFAAGLQGLPIGFSSISPGPAAPPIVAPAAPVTPTSPGTDDHNTGGSSFTPNVPTAPTAPVTAGVPSAPVSGSISTPAPIVSTTPAPPIIVATGGGFFTPTPTLTPTPAAQLSAPGVLDPAATATPSSGSLSGNTSTASPLPQASTNFNPPSATSASPTGVVTLSVNTASTTAGDTTSSAATDTTSLPTAQSDTTPKTEDEDVDDDDTATDKSNADRRNNPNDQPKAKHGVGHARRRSETSSPSADNDSSTNARNAAARNGASAATGGSAVNPK